MSKQAEKVKHELQEELNKFSTLRAQIKKLVEARNKLDVQLNENRLVKEVSSFALALRIDFSKVYFLCVTRNWTCSKTTPRPSRWWDRC